MDPDLMVNAVPRLFEDLLESRFPDVAHAMMTTDTVPKMAHAEVSLKGGEVIIAGMTKGSGMIQPNLATTLGFVMTDAAISPIHLRQMLVRAVEHSYNRLSVDGDTSTNDIVVLLANGASGIRHREFAASQDCDWRRGRELGPRSLRGGAGRRRFRSVQGRYLYAGRSRMPGRAGSRLRRNRSQDASERQRSDDPVRNQGRRQGRNPLLDVRSHR
jgi:glutamate N-acetyltransferase/amino-acid N-acetyltransferase